MDPVLAGARPDRLERRLALAGLASPIVLATAAVWVAATRPEYSHLTRFLSELGATGTPHASWMNYGGIVPAGLLIGIAALPTYRGFGPGVLAILGSVLLLMGALGLTAAGILHCDAGCPAVGGSQANALHITCARLGLFSGSLAPLAFGLGAVRRPQLRVWAAASVLLALVLYALAFAPVDTAYPGARQRAFLGIFYAWLVVSCLRVRGQS